MLQKILKDTTRLKLVGVITGLACMILLGILYPSGSDNDSRLDLSDLGTAESILDDVSSFGSEWRDTSGIADESDSTAEDDTHGTQTEHEQNTAEDALSTSSGRQNSVAGESASGSSSKAAGRDNSSRSSSTSSSGEKSTSSISPSTGSASGKEASAYENKQVITVMVSIDCSTAVEQGNEIAKAISNNGTILYTEVQLEKGGTVYDALLASGVVVGASSSSMGMYVYSINSLKEKEVGANSGWMYSVNGSYASASCSKYALKNGDVIQWRYTCNGGKDL